MPVTIMLGLGISTVNVVGLQVVAQNSSTLNGQYYLSMAFEAAQAGMASAKNCIKAGTTTWSDSAITPLTPATGCNGVVVIGKSSTVANDDLISSTFEVRQMQMIGLDSAVLTSVGKVAVKGPGGATVKTYTKSIRTFVKVSAPTTTRVSKAVTGVSVGPNFACALANSWVYCWGSNDNYRLGTGAAVALTSYSAKPVAVSSNLTPVTPPPLNPDPCGGWFQPACTPTVIQPTQPVSAMAGKKVTKVSVGTSHVCAVATDTDGSNGRAYCWGNNASGQLGNRSTVTSAVPVAVDTAALDYQPPPQNPDPCGGWFQPACSPTVVQPLQPKSAIAGKTIVDISAGLNFTCALASDGDVACWGNNSLGQLGTNDTTSATYPRAVSKSAYKPGVAAVYSTPSPCGGWFQPSCTPVLVTAAIPEEPASALWNNTATKLARLHDAQTMCVVDANNRALCWGNNSKGQIGDKARSTSGSDSDTSTCSGGAQYPPYPTPKINFGYEPQPTFTQLTYAFDSFTIFPDRNIAKTNDTAGTPNRLYSWSDYTSTVTQSRSQVKCGNSGGGGSDPGTNKYERTSKTSWSATSSISTTPLYSAAGTGLTNKQINLFSGNAYSGLFCAQSGSDVYCDLHGGNGTEGQLGNNVTYTYACTSTWFGTTCSGTQAPSGPQRIYMDGWFLGKTLQAIDSGDDFTCAVADGTVGCWGLNNVGQLGDNTTANRNAPTPVFLAAGSDLGEDVTVSSPMQFDNPVSF